MDIIVRKGVECLSTILCGGGIASTIRGAMDRLCSLTIDPVDLVVDTLISSL